MAKGILTSLPLPVGAFENLGAAAGGVGGWADVFATEL